MVAQPVLAEGLARVLDSTDDLRLISASSTIEHAIQKAALVQPAVLIADLAFGTRMLLDTINAIKQVSPGTRIVVWTKDLSPGDRRQLLEAGARGLLDKSYPIANVLVCIRAVARGEVWTGSGTPGEDEYLRAALRLTSRERQVLACLREGMKNREIAHSLVITPGTVKVHLMHIFEKTGLRDRNELAMHADRLLQLVRTPVKSELGLVMNLEETA